MANQTSMSKCVFCGNNATKKNQAGQPVCKEHRNNEPKDVACPECGMPMKIREGRHGFFWGCEGYPQCDKTYQIEAIADTDDE